MQRSSSTWNWSRLASRVSRTRAAARTVFSMKSSEIQRGADSQVMVPSKRDGETGITEQARGKFVETGAGLAKDGQAIVSGPD